MPRTRDFSIEKGCAQRSFESCSNLQVAGVASGELDFMSGVGTAFEAMRKGAPLKVLAVLYRAPLFSLVSGAAIKAPKDLEGKKVGVSRIGSESHNGRGLDADPERCRRAQGNVHSNRQHHR